MVVPPPLYLPYVLIPTLPSGCLKGNERAFLATCEAGYDKPLAYCGADLVRMELESILICAKKAPTFARAPFLFDVSQCSELARMACFDELACASMLVAACFRI